MADDLTRPPFAAGMSWWTCSYEQDGARYGIDIPAFTAAEAEKLLHGRFGHGTVDGQLAGTVPVSPQDFERIIQRFRDG